MKAKQVKQPRKKKNAGAKKLFSKNASTFFAPVSTHVDPIKKAVEPVVTSVGFSLPAEIRKFFEPRFNLSFDNVRIHSGNKAAKSAEALNANAYTYKDHIVFNEGKYDPETIAGKNLLAHELAHIHLHKENNIILTQTKNSAVKVATPSPRGAVKQSSGGYSVKVGYITIDVLPDVLKSSSEPPKGANTYFEYVVKLTIPPPDFQLDQGKVKSFVAFPALKFQLSVQTRFGVNVNPSGPTDYGYGTRPQDKKAGTTSISFHEGSHGTEFINYIKKEISKYPFPNFEGKVGMTEKEFLTKYDEYGNKVGAIHAMTMEAVKHARVKVDCAGISIDKHNAGRKDYVNVCP